MANKSSAGKRRKPKRTHPWLQDKMAIPKKGEHGINDFLAVRMEIHKGYGSMRGKVKQVY